MHGSVVDLARARHLPDWGQWQHLTADAPPHLAPEFFALAAPFTPGDATLVAEAWDGDTMVGALPLVRDRDRLTALRCDFTPAYDYRGTVGGIDAIWRALREDPTWHELVIGKLPVDSPLATRLPALAGADGCPVTFRLDSRHPYFLLQGFEDRLSPKFRTNLQRCARKAGGIELERIAIPDRAAFDEALAIEAMAWKGAAGTSIDADPRATHLYRVLSRLVGRRDRGALYFLRAGGRRIATLFAIEDRHTLYALKIGYDPAVANLSPGHLLVWKVAAEAEARGLATFDFVGREDDWKRKWTELVHEHVALVIYRNTPKGLASYAMRELIKPRLPDALRDGWRSPLPRGCQRSDIIGAHSLVARLRGRIDRGLGIKSGIARAIHPPAPRPHAGDGSQFPPGSWVRVRAASALHETLDDRDRTRGLLFTPAQWDTAGQVFRVAKHVQRLRDDHGRFRPVSRTVLLEHADCAGHGPEPAGCGRHCPLMYRDEWLEPASAPQHQATPVAGQHARIRDLDAILAGLDLHGRRDGLTFMPEMRAYAGKRFTIANKLTTVYEYDRWIGTRAPVYILDGLHCASTVLGDAGPCDRACALMWHEDWLLVEPA